VRVCAIVVVPAPRDHARRLVVDRLQAHRLAVLARADGDQPPLDLADRLAGDDDDVAVRELDAPATSAARSSPGPQLGQPRTARTRTARQAPARSSAARAIAVVASQVGHEQRHRAHLDARAPSRPASAVRPASRRAARRPRAP
jgi:hypothetical protein